MEEITLYHPELQVERRFPASSLLFHRAAGWQPVSERDEPAAAEPQAEQMSAEEAKALGSSGDLPARSASKADWQEAAKGRIPDDEINGLTKDELVARLTGSQE